MDWKVSAELALVHKETILNGSLIDKINIRYYFMLILPLIFWLGILFQSISYSCFEEPHLIFWEQCFDCNWGPLFGNLTLVLFTHVLFPFTKLSSIQDCFFLKYENWLLASAVSHRALCGEQSAWTGLALSESGVRLLWITKGCSICNRRSSGLHNDPGMSVQRVVPSVESWRLWYSDIATCVFACVHLNAVSKNLLYLQTEDPAMERPYTFKDFLLRPRRSVWAVFDIKWET